MRSSVVAATSAVLSFPPFALAASPADVAPIPPCPTRLGPAEVAACAIRQSPEVRIARRQLDVLAGQRIGAGAWLPSNPVIALGFGRRKSGASGGPSPALDWNVTLAQEIEIAGQKSARLDVVDAKAAAQVKRVAAAEQEVAARALAAYFETVAAAEATGLTRALSQTAEALGTLAAARLHEKLLSGVDADTARAEATRLRLLGFEAERRQAAAAGALALAVGAEAGSIELAGDLTVPAVGDPEQALSQPALEAQALQLRGDPAATEMERRVLTGQLALLRREQVPNVTLSVFAERDGFDEQVMGVGLAVPLPLPAPIGRSRAGDIAEVIARIDQAKGSADLVKRRVRLEVSQALGNYEARRRALAAFPSDLVGNARGHLSALGEAVTSKQMSVREALAAQRSLIEILLAHVEARLALAKAWVELQRATGAPFPGTRGSR